MKKLSIILFALTLVGFVNAQKLEQTIEKGKADNIKALFHISGGQIHVEGGASELANVNFEYDIDEWDPSVSYTEDKDFGKFVVKASNNHKEKNIDDDNICSIVLNDKMNYSLGVVVGAGLADLNFSDLKIDKALFKLGVGSFDINLANTSLKFLKVDAGIGEAIIDLTGDYKNNLKGEINAGIGELKVYVPENVGAKFKINGFLGDIDADGFKKSKNEYTNDAFGESKHSITMTIKGAIGSIEIIER